MHAEHLEALTQFGVASLMGVLWLWERFYSRRRERQLSEAHARLMHEREQLQVLVELVEKNIAAMERFGQTQEQLVRLLEELRQEASRSRAA